METVENRMVVDWQWPETPSEVEEKLNSAGYEEIGTGTFVPEEKAYDCAMERISQDEDLQKEFVEWFYSGNWVVRPWMGKEVVLSNLKNRRIREDE